MNQAAHGRNAHLDAGKSMDGEEGFGLLLVSACRSKDDDLMDEGRMPRFSRAMWITVVIVVFVVWGIAPSLVNRGHDRSGQAAAIHKAREIGFALHEFATEFERYPDENTGEEIQQKTGSQWKFGNASSNDYFSQLIAAGIVRSDASFYAKKPPGKFFERGPDQVGFGYLMNGKSSFNPKDDPSLPILCASLISDGKTVSDPTFDRSIYDGKAVVARIDCSVASTYIDPKTNRLQLSGGKHLLETGPDTVWGDSATPVIVPPLPKP